MLHPRPVARIPRHHKLLRRQDRVRQRKQHAAQHDRAAPHRQHRQHHGQDCRRVRQDRHPQRARHPRHQHGRHARRQQHHGRRDAPPPGLGRHLRPAAAAPQPCKERDVKEVRDQEAAEAAEKVGLAGPREKGVTEGAEPERGHERRCAAGPQRGKAREQRRRERLARHARRARRGADAAEIQHRRGDGDGEHGRLRGGVAVHDAKKKKG